MKKLDDTKAIEVADNLWWVGFADKPSDAKTVKVRPWRGKFYKKFENSGDGSDPK